MENKKTLEISWVSLWRILFFVLIVAIAYLGRQVFFGLLLALVISSGLETVVSFLERRGIPRTLGVIMLFLAALLIVIVVVYEIIPLIVIDVNMIFAGPNKSDTNSLIGALVNLRASKSLDAAINKLSSEFFSGAFSPLDLFSGALGNLSLALAVLISSFYLSLSKDGVERFIKTVFPPDYEKITLKIYENSRKKIGTWFQAQIVLSIIMGISVWGALTLLGVKHAFLLGIVAALFEIVPFVGPIISGAIAVLVALSASVQLGLYTLVVFLALQQFESNILVPVLMRRSVGLHPVIVITALLIGGEVGGILGIVIAVPAAAVFQEVVDEWSKKKRTALGSEAI